MADTEADQNTGAEAEADATESEGADTSTGTEADAGGGEAADDENADAGDGKGDDTKEDDAEEDDGAEPEVRKKPIDFILARKNAKIAKLSGKGKSGTGDGAGEGNGEDEGEDGDIAPEDKEVVLKTVRPIIEPLLKQNAEQENEKELQTFLQANPDFKPFEAKIRRYSQHQNRAGVPIKAIAYEVAGDKLMALGAKRAKAADDKARQTQTGGGSAREGGGDKSVWDMTPEEFAAKQNEIRAKQR